MITPETKKAFDELVSNYDSILSQQVIDEWKSIIVLEVMGIWESSVVAALIKRNDDLLSQLQKLTGLHDFNDGIMIMKISEIERLVNEARMESRSTDNHAANVSHTEKENKS